MGKRKKSKLKRYTASYLENNPGEKDAIQQEHLDRLAKNAGAWNAWAVEFKAYIEKNKLSDAVIDLSGKVLSDYQFIGLHFPVSTDFSHTSFEGTTCFHDATFEGNACFHNTTFEDHVDFSRASFEREALFDNSIFKGEALFGSTHWEVGPRFDGSSFEKYVPDFRTAKFESTPYLSNVDIPDNENRPAGNVQKYRKLKEMANDSHDHQKEIEFFGYETKAARDDEVFGIRKWPGYAYQYLSNFGQSLVLPIAWLFFVFVLSWGAYYLLLINDDLGDLSQSEWTRSTQTPDTVWIPQDLVPKRILKSPVEYSFRFATGVSFPFTTASRKERQQVIIHLFGNPVVPLKYKIVSVIQTLMTILCLFLFALAVRNRFKIKS